MKHLFDELSQVCSQKTTELYSTSFSWAVKTLPRELQTGIFAIYGFVRLADEIVDSFHEFDKPRLLENFKQATFDAIENGISLNPILNSFQGAVNGYNIDHENIHAFFHSMEMDLVPQEYTEEMYKTYIMGSAEVVGLMCLRVFVNGDPNEYLRLKKGAMTLGSAFQKINFLRDLKDDQNILGRSYFPELQNQDWNADTKAQIEADIEIDFHEAAKSIRDLPPGPRKAVSLAYEYYYQLFRKIKRKSSHSVLESRIRVPNFMKGLILLKIQIKHAWV